MIKNMRRGRHGEILARRAIEDLGFAVHDANIIFSANCPNIDLVVFAKTRALYLQVKWSEKPASRNAITIDGSPWTDGQLHGAAPIFNKHDHYQATLVMLVDKMRDSKIDFYLAPPESLESLVRERAVAFAARPKRDGTTRSMNFRKELPRELLTPWHNAWHLLGEGVLEAERI